MHIQLDLNRNDRDALLRHCQEFVPDSGDTRENARLAEALSIPSSTTRRLICRLSAPT